MTTEAAGLGLTDVLAAHASWDFEGGWGIEAPASCECGTAFSRWTGAHGHYADAHRAHVAVEVSRWLRTVLLGDVYAIHGETHWCHDRDGQPLVYERDTEWWPCPTLAALDRVEALSTEEAGT